MTSSEIFQPNFKDLWSGWNSKEFLRKRCIGKVVAYTVEYRDPESGKEYATVAVPTKQNSLTPNDEEGEDLTTVMVENGYATVRRPKPGKEKEYIFLKFIT